MIFYVETKNHFLKFIYFMALNGKLLWDANRYPICGIFFLHVHANAKMYRQKQK